MVIPSKCLRLVKFGMTILLVLDSHLMPFFLVCFLRHTVLAFRLCREKMAVCAVRQSSSPQLVNTQIYPVNGLPTKAKFFSESCGISEHLSWFAILAESTRARRNRY